TGATPERMRSARGPRYEGLRAFLILLFLLPDSPASAAVDCATPGRDGSGSLTGVVNGYWPGTATPAAGRTPLTRRAARGRPASQTAIASGDLLLVIQMQDANIDSSNTDSYGDGVAGGNASGYTTLRNTGRYEYVVASNAVPVAGGTLNLVGTG